MLLVLTLLGCSSWIDQEPACGQDVYHWSDDLLAHVLEGDGSGSFSYDPVDVPRTAVDGAYDPGTGDFSWTESYDAAYYLLRAEVEGYGTVFHDGDLDIYLERTVTDILGETFATAYRVKREGCDMTLGSWDAASETVANAVVQAGSYENEEVWQWESSVTGATLQGSLRDSLLRTQQISADDGSYWYFTTSKPDGTSLTEFSAACGDAYMCEGEYTTAFDGSTTETYTATDDGEVVATVEGSYAYDGSGSSTVAYSSGETCTFEYDAEGGCTYACDDGSDGSC